MTGPTHIVIGMAASIGLARLAEWHITALNLLWIFIGSLAPDIDASEGSISRPGKILRGFLPRIAADFIDGIFQFISKVINLVFGHRGPMHWPIIGVLIFAAGILYPKPWLMWFGWGYLWHILADATTVKGVPLFGPLSNRFISLGKIRTGRKSEVIFVFIPVLLFVLFAGWGLLSENLRFWLDKYYRMAETVFIHH